VDRYSREYHEKVALDIVNLLADRNIVFCEVDSIFSYAKESIGWIG